MFKVINFCHDGPGFGDEILFKTKKGAKDYIENHPWFKQEKSKFKIKGDVYRHPDDELVAAFEIEKVKVNK
jgi:hypothetical protein